MTSKYRDFYGGVGRRAAGSMNANEQLRVAANAEMLILWIPVNVTQFIGTYFVTLTRMSH